MNVLITLGTGNCQHVTISDASSSQILAVIARSDISKVDQDGDPPIINRIREFVRRYVKANPSATLGQIRTAVQAEDF